MLAIALLIAASPMIDSKIPACTSLVPAAIGGPMPSGSIATLRWLGTTNFELAYRGQVILLDTYYDRGPRYRPIGFSVDQVKRADAIFIGHGHWDHIADIAPVAKQTGAKVYGAALSTEEAIKLGVPAAQTQPLKGGEQLKFKGFTVEPVLAQHSTLAPEVLGAFRAAIDKAVPPTPEETAADDAIQAKGSSDPRIIKEGTLAYLFTFENGFKLIYRNSAGPLTEAERATLQRIGGRTDVAIVPYIGQYAASRQLEVTMPIVKLYNARLYLPAHHDEIPGIFVDIGIEPLLTAIRDQIPGARGYSPLYREPVCINVAQR